MKKPKLKLVKEDENQDLKIPDAAKLWPESKAHTFQFKGKSPEKWYFKADDPKFTPDDKMFVGICKCVILDMITGEIKYEEVWIPRGVEIISHTILHFHNLLMLKKAEIEANPINYGNQVLEMYKALGY